MITSLAVHVEEPAWLTAAVAASADDSRKGWQGATSGHPQWDGCQLDSVSGAGGVQYELCMSLAPCGTGAKSGAENAGAR